MAARYAGGRVCRKVCIMKTVHILPVTALVILVFGASCTRSPVIVIPPDKIDQHQLANAERIGRRLMMAWRDGVYESLNEEFSPDMQTALSPRAQRAAANQIRAMFGDFEDMKFVEAVRLRNSPGMTIYRFRGKFSATGSNPEIRVVLDAHGRVTGFWCLKWRRRIKT